ncbi:hypothetical protein [Tenacibaculum sp. M341]|uniref:hypothetical protein n=1 Tax=Tenacibaculum sp. M341 TaxID=2530339 RepID=UPI0010509010|nr:hypothetical protein [Tenacibaculum sp. M341]TCI85707.1 hypothetical protein EYW44_16100 [Tenacibaculum sp. M341]
MKNFVSIVFFISLTIAFTGCNSLEKTIEKSYAELKSNNIDFIKKEYHKRCEISDIRESTNEIEIRRYEYILVSQTMNLISFIKNDKNCYSQIFAESNVPKRKIHFINTSNLNSCSLIEKLLENNIHKLTDYKTVYEEITKDKPFPFIREDDTSYIVQVKIRDKIYEVYYGDFYLELKLFPKNKELNEYNKISRILDNLDL